MKIAFCYEKIFPARGGCETYICDLARRLTADGHEVHLYACSWDPAALPTGVHYHALSVSSGPRFLRPWLFGAACAEALRRGDHDLSIGFDKTWGQDILYPQGGLHAASADHNLRKYPHVLTRCLAGLAKKLDLAHRSFSRLERRQYLGSDQSLVIVISNMVRDHFRRYYGTEPARLRVLHAAIDPGRFDESNRLQLRREFRQRWHLRPDETAGLFVAMNYRLKGLEPLLHAVARLGPQPFRLLVVGHPRTGRYQRLARRLGIEQRVSFLGPNRDVRTAYFAADFLVHPTFYDPCSLVVLEALACGLPVITTRYNGAGELLRPPREGYIIHDPHHHEELAEAMRQLLDPDRRAACGRAARQAAARWTFEHHYQQLLQLFAEAAARRRANSTFGERGVLTP
ncbi:MAG: glycosyltransferase family 4 protein [Planctomycetes bacterium]|nr:glycosyltransferase family 4 protein [Planctomycetota bacterium]